MKKVTVFLIVILLIFSACAQNFLNVFSFATVDESGSKTNTSVLKKLSSVKAADVEEAIREAERKRLESLSEENKKKRIEETLLKLEKGQISLSKVFANTCFVGDSLLNGLEVYNILNAERLVTRVSARLDHLEENTGKITEINPKVLILHYGINMLWDNDEGISWFISDYSKLVKKLKKALPNTRIIISGIFPVDEDIVSDTIFYYIPRHNEALEKMCSDIGVEFLDSTEFIKTCKDYYSPDGIHFTASFYSEKWLPYIVEAKGITE